MPVDVVVPTFRRPEALARCLEALAAQTVAPASISVIDDDETDRGPAWARNQGIVKGSADIVAFTDDDCVPAPDWIASIEAAFEDPDVGAVEGSMIHNGPDGDVSMDRPLWVLHDRYRTANMAVRRSILEEIGGFDEGYFIHREDTDLGWRIRLAGHRLVYDGRVVVYHPDRQGVHRINVDSAVRLYHVQPKWYAEILAIRLHRRAIADKKFQRIWKCVTAKPEADDLRPLRWHEKAGLLARSLGIAVKWRLGIRGSHPENA